MPQSFWKAALLLLFVNDWGTSAHRRGEKVKKIRHMGGFFYWLTEVIIRKR